MIWTARVNPKYKRLMYYFELEADGEVYCLFENKLCLKSEKDEISKQLFKYAWLNPSDVIKPPAWASDTVWYQIMPDRFCRDGNAEPNSKFKKWGDLSIPHFNDVYGGNLRGITEKLNYLKNLGVGGIYMTPIFESNSNHKYNTFDYAKIDPDFGTEDDLKELISKAHDMGIKVMLDAVFNHCGSEFKPWLDVKEKGRDSKYFDWFFINSEDFANDGYSTEDGRFYSFSFWSGMPKLNTNNPEVVKYFNDLCVYWAREWDIDGIRFDVGDEVSHSFMRQLNTAVKSVKPDIFLLGEIWNDSISWLDGNEYDSVMNYPFMGSVNDFWNNKKLTSTDLMYGLNYCHSLYPEQVTEVLFNFLDTHDTSRAIESCKNKDVLLQKLAVLMTMPGSPCIYYGTEIAMKGLFSPYNRACMPWDKIDRGEFEDFSSEVKKLIELRHSSAECKSSEITYEINGENPRLVCYTKAEKLRVYLNAGKKSCKIIPAGEILYSNKFSGETLEKDGILIESLC